MEPKRHKTPLAELRNVLFAGSRQYGYVRDVLRGVKTYVRDHRPMWRLRIFEVDDIARIHGKFGEPIHGMIAFVSDERFVHLFGAAGCPIVNYSSRMDTLPPLTIVPNNHAIGECAARHFLQLNLQHFACMGIGHARFSKERIFGFKSYLQDKGYGARELSLNDYETLRRLPKPLGIFAVADNQAAHVATLAHDLGLRVPDDVAILGVDNDDLICEGGLCGLSSIDSNGEKIGYECARLLAAIFSGSPVPHRPTLINPRDVVQRESTDIMASDDPELYRAMQIIRAHGCSGLSVDSLLDSLTVSRRTLEVRFKKRFGRTLHDEIRRVQIEHAKYLLLRSEANISVITKQCGFNDPHRFARVFSQIVGLSPRAYREQNRIGRP